MLVAMRSVHLFGLASCLVFSSSIAVTRQEQVNAEQAFKNIQSFKGKKASDVIPAMQFMSASLKVNCQYCHTADFSSDDKEEKNTAREMIAMQNDINARHFGGRTQVTCATCHGGRTHPLNLPPTPGVETRARRSRDITPEQIVQAFTKAAGDKPLPATRWEGVDTSTGAKLKAEAVYDSGKFYFAVSNPKGDLKFVSNGSDLWYLDGKELRQIPPDVAVQFQNQALLLVTPANLPKLANPSAGTAQIKGKDMLVLSGTMPDGKVRASIFFDKLTGLPARSTYYYPTILGNMAEINDYADYKKIAGFELPTTIENHSGEQDTVRHFTSIKLNPVIDPAIFKAPKP
jgi:hypothetical protein